MHKKDIMQLKIRAEALLADIKDKQSGLEKDSPDAKELSFLYRQIEKNVADYTQKLSDLENEKQL